MGNEAFFCKEIHQGFCKKGWCEGVSVDTTSYVGQKAVNKNPQESKRSIDDSFNSAAPHPLVSWGLALSRYSTLSPHKWEGAQFAPQGLKSSPLLRCFALPTLTTYCKRIMCVAFIKGRSTSSGNSDRSRCHRSRFAIGNSTRSNHNRNQNSQPEILRNLDRKFR